MAKRYPIVADDQQQKIIPRTAQVIPRTGAWTGDNQLGNRAKYDPDSRGTQTILKMDEWGPPDIWTVSLFLEERLEAFDGFNVWAEVNFGVGGGTQVYEVDWINGTQFSLPMNAINVVAHFEDVDITTEGSGLQLAVQIARGARGGNNPPVRTISEDFVANTSVVRIPEFAKEIVMVPADHGAAFETNFFSVDTRIQLSSGNTGGSHVVASVSGTRAIGGEIRLPVVGQAKYVSAGYFGLGTFPAYTLYAELDG